MAVCSTGLGTDCNSSRIRWATSPRCVALAGPGTLVLEDRPNPSINPALPLEQVSVTFFRRLFAPVSGFVQLAWSRDGRSVLFSANLAKDWERDLLNSDLHEVSIDTREVRALTSRKGRLELAAGGTLFLDEVAHLPLALQGRLLRVLQEGCFERQGGQEHLRVAHGRAPHLAATVESVKTIM